MEFYASTLKLDATSSQNVNMDDNDPGDVFRIPDLWRPSGFLDTGTANDSLLFSSLSLDGMLLLKADNNNG
jgi:hypothetical protein